MDKKISYAIKSGFIIALAGTLLMLFLLVINYVGPQSVNNNNLMVGGTILFISLYIFLLIGIYKSIVLGKNLNQGVINFTKAFQIGLIASISTGVFSVIFTLIFYELIYPEYNLEMKQMLTEKLSGNNLSGTESLAKIEE